MFSLSRLLGPAVLLFLCSGLYGQFPEYRGEVIDYNAEPQLRSHFDVPHFFPGEREGSFFFNFFNFDPNPVLHFDGVRLDTAVIDGTINARIAGAYTGGYLLHQSDGTWESERTLHLDPVTYNTEPLVDGFVWPVDTLARGKLLLRANSTLYTLEDTPSSLVELPLTLGTYSPSFNRLGERIVYVSTKGIAITDGTAAGTQLIYDGRPSRPQLTVVNDRIYFANSRDELFVSDGTPEGTRPVSFDGIPEDRRPDFGTTALRATRTGITLPVYFPDGSSELWRTDGSPEGTYPLGPLQHDVLVGDGIRTLFRSGPSDSLQIWVTEGSRETTRKLFDLRGREVSNAKWGIHLIARLEDGSLYFSTDENYSDDSFYLLSPDGEVSRVEVPREEGGYSTVYLPTSNRLFLVRRNGTKGLYVHRPGENKVTLLAPFARSSGHFRLAGGGIVVQGDGEFSSDVKTTVIVHQDRVRVLDGHLATNVTSTTLPHGNLALTQAGSQLYGIGIVPGAGEAIFQFDLPTGQRTVLHDLYPHTKDSNPAGPFAGDGAAFFVQEGVVFGSIAGCKSEVLFSSEDFLEVSPLPGTGRSLLSSLGSEQTYRLSDGTRSGTRKLSLSGYRPLSSFYGFRGAFYFIGVAAEPSSQPDKVMFLRLDGESGQLTKIAEAKDGRKDLPQGVYLSFNLASSGDALYFPFNSGGEWAVWRSDGTPAGTQKFTDLPAGEAAAFPYEFSGAEGVVSYSVRELTPDKARLGNYYIAEGEPVPVRMKDSPGFYWSGAVRAAGVVYYTDGDTIYRTEAGGEMPMLFAALPGLQVQELTVIDDTTLVFTTRSYYNATLWRAHLGTGSVVSLVENLEQRFPSPAGELAVIDSLILINPRAGVLNDLVMVNVFTGATVDPGIGGFPYRVRSIVSTGDRFLYVSEGRIYGKEIYVISFGDHVTNESTTVILPSPKPAPTLAVYPNPVPPGGRLTVNLPVPTRYRYRLLDLQGRLVQSGALTSEVSSLTLEQAVPGIYLLQVSGEENRLRSTVRVVISGR